MALKLIFHLSYNKFFFALIDLKIKLEIKMKDLRRFDKNSEISILKQVKIF